MYTDQNMCINKRIIYTVILIIMWYVLSIKFHQAPRSNNYQFHYQINPTLSRNEINSTSATR